MIDKDGIIRPDKFDEHILEVKNQTRKIQFDDKYSYRPRSIFFRAWAAFFRALAICVFNPVMRFKFGLRAYGTENKRKLKGKSFIITCNHVSMLDDLSIGTNIFAWRKIYYTTLDQNIRRPMVGFFLRSLGGIPIPIESLAGMKKFNEDVSFLLSHNKPVLYNPEGALWPKYREIRPYKRGAFSMAVKNNVPVLPFVALFKRRKKKNGKFKYSLYFAICKPIIPDDSLPEHSRTEKMLQETYEVTSRVAREWYNIQDCGFEGDEGKPKLNTETLKFIDDNWVVVEKKSAN